MPMCYCDYLNRHKAIVPCLILAVLILVLYCSPLVSDRRLRENGGRWRSNVRTDSNNHPNSVWREGDGVPWPRVTEKIRKATTMLKESSRFTDAEHQLMGHFCVKPVFLRRKKPIIVLASAPGSGNFWTRYLLEQMTGIYSGSIYAETMAKTRMAGGVWNNASVVVVKAHSLVLGNELHVDGTILLVRNPFHAVKAEFSREATGKHRAAVELEKFKTQKSLFKNNVITVGGRFEKLVSFWVGVSYARPVHVVYFEDLVSDLKGELEKMASFLNVEVPKERLECVVAHREGVNRRNHTAEYRAYDPFDDEMTYIMNEYVRSTARILPRASRYIRPGPGDDLLFSQQVQ